MEVLIGYLIDDEQLQGKVGYESFDLVAANILTEVLLPLTPVAVKHLKKGGVYITSGILEEKEEKITEAVKAAGMELLEVTRQNDWVSVTARKR